jgi:hypothetical protein
VNPHFREAPPGRSTSRRTAAVPFKTILND